MDKARIQAIIELLEHVRLRPLMYIGSHDPNLIECFLTGLLLGIVTMSKGEFTWKPHHLVSEMALSEGIENSREIIPSLRQRGLNDGAITDQLLAWEITAWKQILTEFEEA